QHDRRLLMSLPDQSQTLRHRVVIDARALLNGQGEFATEVETQDTQIIIALQQVGFVRENGRFVYRQSRAGVLQR
ncbi:MAG: hypothetical protein AAGK93_02600, partial [Pseudomonadota bacterium]